ncbi:MAG: bifunctional 2-polyprenyl-6-hydroxyphenol methylase/3-demethylubiquinol 3-O-methyltransferase UbiG [Alphaproteobacteria bacterium]|nr:bifunctional 2-polyprenyl-6-hydroxyphenol methylase/3-demethylubiquinol 3-O-methyltransferase UbiG [Alphaproteobacteria bacterium]
MNVNTQDLEELNHFKALSSSWWNTQGPFRILHAITPLRMAFIKDRVGVHFCRPEISLRPFQNLKILDVGCGGGLLCEPLARLGADVTGIDPLEESISVARNHAEAMGLSITYLSCAIEDLPQDLPLFDVIIASETIEHVTHSDDFLKALITHLSLQGGMIVTTFNKTLLSYILGIVAAEYILKWAPRGTHSWEKFMTPQSLSHKLNNFGLGNQEIIGLNFSPMRGGWYLSPSTDVNYFLWATRS